MNADLLTHDVTSAIEAALPAFVSRQRWYGAHDTPISAARIDDLATIVATDDLLLVLPLVALEDSRPKDLYHLPLAVRRSDHPAVEHARSGHLIVCEVDTDDGPIVIYDALFDQECSLYLWQELRANNDHTTQRGTISFRCQDTAEASGPIYPLVGEQSNTSLVRDDTDALKVIRHPVQGESLEVEMMQALTTVGFPHSLPVDGRITYRVDGAEPMLLGLLQPYVRNSTVGWSLALTALRDLYALAEHNLGDGELSDELISGGFVDEAARLGEVTALLHEAMSDPSIPPPLGRVEITQATLEDWSMGMQADLDMLVARLEPGTIPKNVHERLSTSFANVATLSTEGWAIRIHGDYHLGQLLRSDQSWTIIDFGGEPARDAQERLAHSSPLRDVAGMLRSFDYAAAVALNERSDPAQPMWVQLEEIGQRWSTAMRTRFWSSYITVAASSAFLPPAADALALREAFEHQKAIYEVGYELGHRPAWARIPLQFLLSNG